MPRQQCMCLVVFGLALSGVTPLWAAQQTAPGDLSDMLDTVIDVIEESGGNVHDTATTNRFALLYATTAQDHFVTITLRQLPSDVPKVRIVVDSDPPTSPSLEQNIVQQVVQRANSQ